MEDKGQLTGTTTTTSATALDKASDRGRLTFWDQLGRPRYVLAPMVDGSELAYRALCRAYGAQVCYSPMLHAGPFHRDASYRTRHLSSTPDDRPLIVQFCGNDPEEILQAALLVQDECDAVDINFGCPQKCARKGNFGAYLLHNWPLMEAIVSTLHKNLTIPVCCKIRLLPKLEDTIKLALVLQNAGCQLLAVHGRTRESNSRGPADWAAIRQIKEALSIPVVANGGVDELDDVERCLNETKADAVMVAYPALLNPRFFRGGERADGVELLREYLAYVERYPAQSKTIKSHARKLLKPMWGKHKDLREQLEEWDERDQAIASVVLRIAQELQHRIENGIEIDLKPHEVELEEGDGAALFGPPAEDDY